MVDVGAREGRRIWRTAGHWHDWIARERSFDEINLRPPSASRAVRRVDPAASNTTPCVPQHSQAEHAAAGAESSPGCIKRWALFEGRAVSARPSRDACSWARCRV